MKRVFWLLACLIVMIQFSGCTTVDRGEVGILFNLYGASKGIQDQVVGPGRYVLTPNEYIYTFPTFQMNYVFCKSATEGNAANEEFTFQTTDGMECSMDLGIMVHFDGSKIINMFKKFKKNETEIKDVVLRMEIRNAVNKVCGKMPVEAVYGAGKAVMIDSIQKEVKADLDSTGIIVDKISLIGSVRLPDQITQSINSKTQATQNAMQIENQVRGARAEAEKKEAYAKGIADSILVVATAQAKSNEMLSHSISQTLVNYEIAKTWKGEVPQVSGGFTPIIDLRPAGK